MARLGVGFVSGTAKVNGTELHYVRGGHGPAVVLIHGYPQDWTEYREIMPRLAREFTVVAVDLRGVGGSAAPPSGYAAPNLAEDVRQLTRHLGLRRVYVVGHDIGGMTAYAYARLAPDEIRGAMILDVPLPGMDPWTDAVAGMWHIGFFQVPDLPEELIAGRQAAYFRYVLPRSQFSDADVARYAASYARPAQLHAGFELYREFPANAKFNAAPHRPLQAPIVWATGTNSFFAKLGPQMADALRAHGCANVTTAVIPDSDHFVVNEQPDIVTSLIERNAG
ncbi:alpha/beta hydrolase [Actinophytocola sp.]|uniref:alpha/beta fold hydrolase n=1 Tax=Actinophytocola sp. TaxID=1872138 RepID=UPI002D788F4D|nr:alpha/beta hydrolase [Actinophytocola sp.]